MKQAVKSAIETLGNADLREKWAQIFDTLLAGTNDKDPKPSWLALQFLTKQISQIEGLEKEVAKSGKGKKLAELILESQLKEVYQADCLLVSALCLPNIFSPPLLSKLRDLANETKRYQALSALVSRDQNLWRDTLEGALSTEDIHSAACLLGNPPSEFGLPVKSLIEIGSKMNHKDTSAESSIKMLNEIVGLESAALNCFARELFAISLSDIPKEDEERLEIFPLFCQLGIACLRKFGALLRESDPEILLKPFKMIEAGAGGGIDEEFWTDTFIESLVDLCRTIVQHLGNILEPNVFAAMQKVACKLIIESNDSRFVPLFNDFLKIQHPDVPLPIHIANHVLTRNLHSDDAGLSQSSREGLLLSMIGCRPSVPVVLEQPKEEVAPATIEEEDEEVLIESPKENQPVEASVEEPKKGSKKAKKPGSGGAKKQSKDTVAAEPPAKKSKQQAKLPPAKVCSDDTVEEEPKVSAPRKARKAAEKPPVVDLSDSGDNDGVAGGKEKKGAASKPKKKPRKKTTSYHNDDDDHEDSAPSKHAAKSKKPKAGKGKNKKSSGSAQSLLDDLFE